MNISFFINGKHLELRGKKFLLGALTVDVLSIPPDEFSAMHDIKKQMQALSQKVKEQRLQNADDTSSLLKLLCQLHDMLIKHELFKLMLGELSCEELSRFYSAADADVDLLMTRLNSQLESYFMVVDDIYSFNQTIFYFVDRFLSRLKKLDPENYAAALFDFYNHPSADKMIVNFLRDGMLSFNFTDTIGFSFVPREVDGKPDEYVICEYYTVDYLQAFLKIDFMKAIMNGHIIRRCKNCKRFFLLTRGYHNDYCTRAVPDKPNKTCQHVGAKNIAKLKAKDIPPIQSYNRAIQRINADCNRGYITTKERDKAKAALADIRDRALSAKMTGSAKHEQVDYDAVDEMMQSKNLYPALGIIRKGKR